MNPVLLAIVGGVLLILGYVIDSLPDEIQQVMIILGWIALIIGLAWWLYLALRRRRTL